MQLHDHDPPGNDVSRDPRLRADAITTRAVFVAPRRADRPIDAAAATGKDSAATCPFCAGHEHLAPPETMRIPISGPWHARIVPNRYPVVENFIENFDTACGPPPRPAHGVHDVLVESPGHVVSILDIDPGHWRDAWELCRRRLATLAGRADLAWGMVFKNSGPLAGASLAHVHSQIVAIDFVPPAIQEELDRAGSRDAFGELVGRAEAEGRIVEAAEGLVAIVPEATRQPFETWIVPRDDEPAFHTCSMKLAHELADLTRSVVRRLGRVAPGVDYNWWLHQAPFRHARTDGPRPGFRWHLEILPRLAPFAGFELGTGCHITTMPPERSAALLGRA